jgi:hypothetical protein
MKWKRERRYVAQSLLWPIVALIIVGRLKMAMWDGD